LLADSSSKKTHQRLKAIVKAEDGFELSEKDLEIRGPGSLYGAKQWGIPDLAMKNFQNIALVEKTKEEAKQLLIKDPELKKYPYLRDKLKRFQKTIHLE
jgi:ATP-dependent DNA helicase RecG